MTEIFNINRINRKDQLREKKINTLNSLKDYLKGMKTTKNGTLELSQVSLNALEKYLPSIIQEYSYSSQKEDSTLRELSEKYPDFKNNWHEQIVYATEVKKINEVQSVVVKAILKWGPLLSQELARTKDKLDFSKVFGGDFEEDSVQRARERLNTFKAKFPYSTSNGTA